jgi:hypothetical protein
VSQKIKLYSITILKKTKMKKKTTNQNMNESQIWHSIKDAAVMKLIFIQKRRTNGPAVPNHPNFGGAGGRLCTGPPGRARSPGVPKPVRFETTTEKQPVQKGHFNQVRLLPENYLNTECQIFSSNYKFNLLQTFNFKIMKKQILILAFFVLALMAGSLSSFGQMGPSTVAPTPLNAINCKPSPLNPIAGLPFTYAVTNPNTVATGYTWWATKNPNFINTTTFASDMTSMLTVAPGQLIATGANYGTANAATGTMDITWTANILAATDYQGTPAIGGTPAAPSPTFVVVQADGSCNNNLQVFELNPLPSFTLDIANIDPADNTTTLAYGTDATQCADIVRGASYSGASVAMDYGTNTMLFEVIAANYVTNWIPTFQIVSGLTANQTATIGWAYTAAAALAGTFIDGSPAAVVGANIVGTTALVPAAGLNTSLGTSIYVRIIVDNNQFESTALQPLVLAVDGQDASAQWDIDQASATCSGAANDLKDQATHNVTPRPDIIDATGDSNPTPDNTFIVSPRP